MPTVAIIDGVKIQFYAREHPPPHFHAVFAEYRAQIDIASLSRVEGQPAAHKALGCGIVGTTERAGATKRLGVDAAKQKPEKIP